MGDWKGSSLAAMFCIFFRSVANYEVSEDVSGVVEVVHSVGIGKNIARLAPIPVIKG
jgi:hypothetical protein